MVVDISKIFRANIKAIRMNQPDDGSNSSLNAALNEQILLKSKNQKNQQLKSRESISKEAKNITTNISILKNFLNENKSFYIQPNYLLYQNEPTCENDFQNFEDQAESVIKRCSDSIHTLKRNTLNQDHNKQYREHLENMFQLIESYLKDVCKIYSEQKAIRVKRILQKKNYSQLCSPEASLTGKSTKQKYNENLDEEINKPAPIIANDLSEQDLMELEKENEFLYDNLAIQNEEIRKIESEVIEVSKLTQIFTENIVSQLKIAENVQKLAVETNSNLTSGNQNITEAMKKNAALRLWVLFIIVVLSFTLLFLDWYND
jgi:syntaxin 18